MTATPTAPMPTTSRPAAARVLSFIGQRSEVLDRPAAWTRVGQGGGGRVDVHTLHPGAFPAGYVTSARLHFPPRCTPRPAWSPSCRTGPPTPSRTALTSLARGQFGTRSASASCGSTSTWDTSTRGGSTATGCGSTGRTRIGEPVGAVAVSAAGDMLVAGQRGLKVIEAAGGRRSLPPILKADGPQRFNDGKCDPAGRFLVGSMREDYLVGGEVLVRCELDGAVTVLDDDLGLSNGLAWTEDGRTMFSIDTLPGRLWARGYDPASGAVGPRRLVRTFDDGNADGICMDTDGQLWIAFYGPGEVRRYTQDGTLTGVVEVASPHTTSCAFVGPARDRLLITSATQESSPRCWRSSPTPAVCSSSTSARAGSRRLPGPAVREGVRHHRPARGRGPGRRAAGRPGRRGRRRRGARRGLRHRRRAVHGRDGLPAVGRGRLPAPARP